MLKKVNFKVTIALLIVFSLAFSICVYANTLDTFLFPGYRMTCTSTWNYMGGANDQFLATAKQHTYNPINQDYYSPSLYIDTSIYQDGFLLDRQYRWDSNNYQISALRAYDYVFDHDWYVTTYHTAECPSGTLVAYTSWTY